MATFAFIHGAGDVGRYWHLVEAELAALLERYVVETNARGWAG